MPFILSIDLRWWTLGDNVSRCWRGAPSSSAEEFRVLKIVSKVQPISLRGKSNNYIEYWMNKLFPQKFKMFKISGNLETAGGESPAPILILPNAHQPEDITGNPKSSALFAPSVNPMFNSCGEHRSICPRWQLIPHILRSERDHVCVFAFQNTSYQLFEGLIELTCCLRVLAINWADAKARVRKSYREWLRAVSDLSSSNDRSKPNLLPAHQVS